MVEENRKIFAVPYSNWNLSDHIQLILERDDRRFPQLYADLEALQTQVGDISEERQGNKSGSLHHMGQMVSVYTTHFFTLTERLSLTSHMKAFMRSTPAS